MAALIQDLRRAWRALRSRPWYVTTSIVTLTLAIGAATAVFSVVDALMLRPLPYRDPGQIVELQSRVGGGLQARFGLDVWRQFQQQRSIFDQVETSVVNTHVMIARGEPTIAVVTSLSEGMLAMLGVRPRLGRAFTPDDAAYNGGRVLLLSARLWREQFGSDPNIVGQTIMLDASPFEIVGVMPDTFRFPQDNTQAWRPLIIPPTPPGGRQPRFELIARVRTGLPVAQAERDFRAFGGVLREARLLGPALVLEFNRIQTINDSNRTPLYVLLGAVLLVLAVGCLNVANLTLANGSERRREIAVRTALGASRATVVRQLLCESATIAVSGGVAGAWLAYVLVDILAPLIPSDIVSLSAHAIQVDGRVLLFALAATIVCVLVTGLLPAIRGSRANVVDTLKSSGRGQSASRAERRVLGSVGIAQCALAVMLLASATLMIKSFLKLQAVDPGFDAHNLLVVSLPVVQVAGDRYPDAPAQLALMERLAEDIGAMPGVIGTTIAGGTPPRGGGYVEAHIETDRSAPGPRVLVPFAAVAADYFRVMGIRMMSGRTFVASDPPTHVVIDEVFARRYWGSAAAAVGRRFRLDADGEWNTVVGVTVDVKQTGLDGKRGEGLEFYHPFAREGRGWGGTYGLVVRTASDPQRLLPAVKARIWAVDPRLPLYEGDDMRQRLAESIARPRFFFILLTLFAVVAAIIAAVGVYSVFSYSVTQRRHEIGIRLAVGATAPQIAARVMSDGAAMSVAGVVFGLFGAWVSSRAIATLLFETEPTDPLALAAGSACLVTLALVACYVPARRAQRVDPVAMLRME